MTHLHLVRHGKRAQHIGDPALTDEGKTEAQRLAGRFGPDIDSVFASPLTRARETARIIAGHQGLDVTIDVRLRERMNWGDLPDQPFDEFAAEMERCDRERTYRPEGGDSSVDAGRRIEAFVAERVTGEQHAIIAVPHGGILADYLFNVFTTEELADIRPEFLDSPYSGDVIPECSVTTILFDGTRYRLLAIGQPYDSYRANT